MRFSTVAIAGWVYAALFLSRHVALADQTAPATPPAPYPEIIAAAPGQGWAFDDLDAMTDDPLRPGDKALALITLFDGEEQKQWVVSLTIVVPTAEEQKKMTPPPPLKIHTSNGSVLEFVNEFVLVEAKTFGPFFPHKQNRKALNPRTARTVVNVEHLKLGFDRACSTLLRLKAASRHLPEADRFGMEFGPQPYPPEKVSKTRRVAEIIGLRPEDEKAFAGTLPALFGFFQIALTTPGLQEILLEVVDIPYWSVVRKGGKVEPYFNFDGRQMSETAGKDGIPRYSMPVTMTLNGKHALNLTFGVVAPRSPVITTAGILGVAAHHPTDPKKSAIIQIVSAKRTP